MFRIFFEVLKVSGRNKIKFKYLNYMLNGMEKANHKVNILVSRTNKDVRPPKGKSKDNRIHLSLEIKLPFTKQMNYENEATQSHIIKEPTEMHKNTLSSNSESTVTTLF